MSFWLKDYESIVRALLDLNKPVGGVADFLSASDNTMRVILRHDVDRRPAQACAMAKLEQHLGARSTYYFRANAAGCFPADAVRVIAGMGHEVGYHYEDLSFCKGDREAALARFFHNLETFRKLAPCVTVSMHGAPLSRHHNQDLLRKEDLARASLLGDAVASIQSFAPYYLTDTGGRWLAEQANLRDRVGRCWPADALPDNIPAFSRFAAKARQPLYISTHPERWNQTIPGYIRAKAADTAINCVKMIIRRARSIRQP